MILDNLYTIAGMFCRRMCAIYTGYWRFVDIHHITGSPIGCRRLYVRFIHGARLLEILGYSWYHPCSDRLSSSKCAIHLVPIVCILGKIHYVAIVLIGRRVKCATSTILLRYVFLETRQAVALQIRCSSCDAYVMCVTVTAPTCWEFVNIHRVIAVPIGP